MNLFERDRGKATGLALVPKLKYEHIHLSSFSKMRVDLAAQVCDYYTVYFVFSGASISFIV